MKYFSDGNEGGNPQMVLALGDNFYEFGVQDVNDSKFQKYWRDVYKGSILDIPWYIVQGNHDWRGNPDAQLKFAETQDNWIYPDFFYDIEVNDLGDNLGSAGFIFIETGLLYYGSGSEGYGSGSSYENYKKKGWTEPKYYLQQLHLIEEKLIKFNSTKDYIFVAGHHPALIVRTKKKKKKKLIKNIKKKESKIARKSRKKNREKS
ncbi:Tartrate-resistant acid phosphatase type 5 [Lobulomyces angularis]|nr:Tartrate-resistant acid phosphatase type 5 [Lobulomyces angularis]